MPPIPERMKRKREVEAALARWEAFERPSAWRRSRRGNLWRTWGDLTVSIFYHADARYHWSVADSDGPRYSSCGYATEEEAMTALGEAIGLSDL